MPTCRMTKVQAQAVVRKLIKKLGLGFHPDTPISDYVETRTGKPSFSPAETQRLQRQIDCAFQTLGVPGIHDYAWNTVRPLLRKRMGKDAWPWV